MRAISQNTFGAPSVLHPIETPKPTPLPSEVLVRVNATGVNPVEPLSGPAPSPMLGQPPFILGWDISGAVEEVVPGVTRFEVGDEVYGMPFFPRPATLTPSTCRPLPPAGPQARLHRPRPHRRPPARRSHRLAEPSSTPPRSAR